MDNESVDNVNIDEDEAQNEGDNDMATNNDQEEKNKTDDEESVTLSSASTKPAHQPIANFGAIKQLINPFSGDKDFRSNDVLEFLDSLERVGKLLAWSPNQLLLGAESLLVDKAKTWLISYKQKVLGPLDFELFKKALIVRFDGLINENARRTFKQSLGMKSSQSISDFSDMIEIAAVRIIKSKNREQADLPHAAGTRKIIMMALDSSFDDKPNPNDSNEKVIQKIQVKTLRDSWESQAHSEKIQLFLENVHHSFRSQLIAFGAGSNLTYQ